jgi:hypothetical protein
VRSLRRFLRSDSTAAAVFASRIEGGTAFRAQLEEELPGVDAARSDRIRLRLTRPVLDPLAPLAAAAAAITGAGGHGCGPFVPAVFEPGRRLELAAAAEHPAGRPFLDRILLRASAPGTARPGLAATPVLLLLLLDVAQPPFEDPALRRALAASIDRQALSTRFLTGARPAEGLDGRPGAQSSPARPTFEGSPTITLSVADDVPAAASRRVVAHFAAAGLTARAVVLAPEAARGAPSPARLLLWAPEVSAPDLVLREAATLVRVPAVVERELRRAEVELDPQLREEQLARAHRELIGDAALIPLAALPPDVRPPPALLGARVDATGTLRLDDAWLRP